MPLFEFLRPRFAWVDLDGPYPGGLVNDVLGSDIHWIFWFNYYGSEYLSKHGAEFFSRHHLKASMCSATSGAAA